MSRHTALVCSRLAPEENRGVSCPTIKPATTTASTPELWISSPTR